MYSMIMNLTFFCLSGREKISHAVPRPRWKVRSRGDALYVRPLIHWSVSLLVRWSIALVCSSVQNARVEHVNSRIQDVAVVCARGGGGELHAAANLSVTIAYPRATCSILFLLLSGVYVIEWL